MNLPERQNNSTTAEIYKWYASKPQSHREHLGASIIGSECDRYLWQTFRWVALPQFEGRILRLFDTGTREEARVFDELRGIGVELHTHEDGKQISCRDTTGHFGGSVDAIARGLPEAPKTWAIVEIKTHNAKSWADVKAKGVADSKPKHYAQMQVYMRFLNLDRSLYFAVNKDTDHVYTEWVHHDKSASNVLLGRAERACEQHLFIPPLVPTGGAVDAGEGWVEYEMPGGKTFRNGEAYLTSRELEIAPQDVIESPQIAEIKAVFPGARIEKVTPVRKRRNAKDLSLMAYAPMEPYNPAKRIPGDPFDDDIPF
jgi:hypothetical protein